MDQSSCCFALKGQKHGMHKIDFFNQNFVVLLHSRIASIIISSLVSFSEVCNFEISLAFMIFQRTPKQFSREKL